MTAEEKNSQMRLAIRDCRDLLWKISEDAQTSQCLRTTMHRVVFELAGEYHKRGPRVTPTPLPVADETETDMDRISRAAQAQSVNQSVNHSTK